MKDLKVRTTEGFEFYLIKEGEIQPTAICPVEQDPSPFTVSAVEFAEFFDLFIDNIIMVAGEFAFTHNGLIIYITGDFFSRLFIEKKEKFVTKMFEKYPDVTEAGWAQIDQVKTHLRFLVEGTIIAVFTYNVKIEEETNSHEITELEVFNPYNFQTELTAGETKKEIERIVEEIIRY